MSEAEKFKKIRDKLVNDYAETLENRVEFCRISLGELKEFGDRFVKRDALFEKKLEKLETAISELTYSGNMQVTAVVDATEIWSNLSDHLESMTDDLDLVPGLREDAEQSYEDEKKDEEDEDEDEEDEDEEEEDGDEDE